MNNKVKALLGVIAFAVIIAGASFAYNRLSNIVDAPDSLRDYQINNTVSAAQEEAEDDKIPAPDFTVVDADNNEVKLSDFFGKPIVLNFWASWCPPCKQEMPDFNKVYEEMGDDVIFMMVDLVDGQRETKAKGEQYVAEQSFTFPVYYDISQEAAYIYEIASIPTTIFIDKDGCIITGAQGAIDEKILRKGIGMISDISAANIKEAEYRKITAAEAKEMLDNNADAILLDVRTESEFKESRIPDAILLPDYEVGDKAADILPDKDGLILIYCRSGRRSENAARELVDMGYTNVYDFGGIIDWAYDTENG